MRKRTYIVITAHMYMYLQLLGLNSCVRLNSGRQKKLEKNPSVLHLLRQFVVILTVIVLDGYSGDSS